MSTYPLILYPKLLADFRGRYSVKHQESGVRSPEPEVSRQKVETPWQGVCTRAVPEAGAIRWLLLSLGSALIVIGLGFASHPLALIAFVAGISSCGVSFLFRNKHISILPERRGEALNTQPPIALTPATSNRDYLIELGSVMRSAVRQPTGIADAPVGASEKGFALVLERYFPGRVQSQLKMNIPGSELAYSTDFCISLPELGIWIDVEIDEPYDYKSGKPTHCCDDTRDRNRNTFFLGANWIVVRFSERQVVEQPHSCCKEIAQVIFATTRIDVYLKSLLQVPILKPSPMWTAGQARQMAKLKFRDSYLYSPKARKL